MLGLWLAYCVSLTVSLAAMEIFSSLLLLCLLVDVIQKRALPLTNHPASTPQRRVFFVGLALVAIAWVISVCRNVSGAAHCPHDLEALRRLLFTLFPSLIFLNTGRHPRVWRLTFWALSFGVLLSFIVGLCVRTWADQRYAGSFSIAFTYGVSASTLILALLWLWEAAGRPEKVSLLSPLVTGITVLASKTRIAWLGLFLASPWIILQTLSSKKHRWGASIGLALVVLSLSQIPFVKERLSSSFQDQSFQERWVFWRSAWSMGKEAFPWGVGYKSPARLMGQYTPRFGSPHLHDAHAHSHWLEVFAALGPLGVLGWGCIFVSLFLAQPSNTRRWVIAGAIHLLTLSFFDVIFQDAEMAHMGFFFLGLSLL